MRPLGGAVQRVLRAFGLEAEVARADLVEAWQPVAQKFFGEDASHTTAIRVESDTLVISVPSSHWASEVRLRETMLIAALRELVPDSTIAHIRSVPQSVERVPSAPERSPKQGG